MITTRHDNMQWFQRNEQGRDYVVGDIHGCFGMLETLLTYVDFQRTVDRLFALGDLIDRGTRSAEMDTWLAQPWFHSIRGNHEAMLLAATRADGTPMRAGREAALWQHNGGDWFLRLDSTRQAAIRRRTECLPLAMAVALNDAATAVLVHADVLADSWPATRDFLTGKQMDDDAEAARMQLLWSRQRAQMAARACEPGVAAVGAIDVEGVALACFGHTPMRAPLALGNTRWLDTGAVYGGCLSIAELAVDGAVWALPVDAGAPLPGWYTPD